VGGRGRTGRALHPIRRVEGDGIQPAGFGWLPTHSAASAARREVSGGARPLASRLRLGLVAADTAFGFAHPAFDAGLRLLAD